LLVDGTPDGVNLNFGDNGGRLEDVGVFGISSSSTMMIFSSSSSSDKITRFRLAADRGELIGESSSSSIWRF
jgi:hypothetical protein